MRKIEFRTTEQINKKFDHVFENGVITDIGKHKYLLADNGFFKFSKNGYVKIYDVVNGFYKVEMGCHVEPEFCNKYYNVIKNDLLHSHIMSHTDTELVKFICIKDDCYRVTFTLQKKYKNFTVTDIYRYFDSEILDKTSTGTLDEVLLSTYNIADYFNLTEEKIEELKRSKYKQDVHLYFALIEYFKKYNNYI